MGGKSSIDLPPSYIVIFIRFHQFAHEEETFFSCEKESSAQLFGPSFFQSIEEFFWYVFSKLIPDHHSFLLEDCPLLLG